MTWNGQTGFNSLDLAYAPNGNAFAAISHVSANFNGVTSRFGAGVGIAIYGYGARAGDGDATFLMHDIYANFNGTTNAIGGFGVMVVSSTAFATGGNATAHIHGISASFNGKHGSGLRTVHRPLRRLRNGRYVYRGLLGL